MWEYREGYSAETGFIVDAHTGQVSGPFESGRSFVDDHGQLSSVAKARPGTEVRPTANVSGQITFKRYREPNQYLGQQGLPGAEIHLDGGSAVYANSSGNYTYSGVSSGSHTLRFVLATRYAKALRWSYPNPTIDSTMQINVQSSPVTKNMFWDGFQPLSPASGSRSNAVFLATEMHDYFRASPFSFTLWDEQMPITDPGISQAWFAKATATQVLLIGESAAKSSDIVYHEYTHLMIFRLYGGHFIDPSPTCNLSEACAMDEGFADYFAAAKQNNPSVGEATPFPIRNMVNNLTMADYYSLGSPTARGQIIAGAVWDLKSSQELWYYQGQPNDFNRLINSWAYWALWLSPHPVDFVDYFWSFVDASDVSGTASFDPVNNSFCAKGIDTGYCGTGKGQLATYVGSGAPDWNRSFSVDVYPNPFNPSTTVRLVVPAKQQVRVALYDITGREVRKILDELREAGAFNLRLGAAELPSGVYFLRVDTGSDQLVRPVILQR